MSIVIYIQVNGGVIYVLQIMENVCHECGGTDFRKEAGFYYCSECQSQSQELREHVLETYYHGDNEIVEDIKSDPVKECKQGRESHTSWEYYSYILLGLTNELIELGAKEDLRKVVKLIWFKYLEKLEVIGGKKHIPKLAAIYHKE